MPVQRFRWWLATAIITLATAIARWVAPSEAVARRIAGRDEPETQGADSATPVDPDEPRTLAIGTDLVDQIDRELRERGL